MSISYLELLSASISAAEQCSIVICDVLERGANTEYYNKSDDVTETDPQTEADLGAQYVIQTGLFATFPGISIVGEEPEEAVQKYIHQQEKKGKAVQNVTLKKDSFHTDERFNLTNSPIGLQYIPEELQQLDLKHLLVYIDPLDGTREFTAGCAEQVTTLISITYYGYSLGGVVYYPTLKKCIYGGLGIGCYTMGDINLLPQKFSQYQMIQKHPFFSTFCSNWLSKMNTILQTTPDIDQKEFIYPVTEAAITAWTDVPDKVITTRSRFSPSIMQYFERININLETQLLRAGGAGHKGAQVLIGTCRAYVYSNPGPKRWDIGVIDGLLYAYGGMLTDVNGNLYTYNTTDLLVDKGIICSLFEHERYCIGQPTHIIAESSL